jgi:hypothetical protein
VVNEAPTPAVTTTAAQHDLPLDHDPYRRSPDLSRGAR